jgi:hypothetical protein
MLRRLADVPGCVFKKQKKLWPGACALLRRENAAIFRRIFSVFFVAHLRLSPSFAAVPNVSSTDVATVGCVAPRLCLIAAVSSMPLTGSLCLRVACSYCATLLAVRGFFFFFSFFF